MLLNLLTILTGEPTITSCSLLLLPELLLFLAVVLIGLALPYHLGDNMDAQSMRSLFLKSDNLFCVRNEFIFNCWEAVVLATFPLSLSNLCSSHSTNVEGVRPPVKRERGSGLRAAMLNAKACSTDNLDVDIFILFLSRSM